MHVLAPHGRVSEGTSYRLSQELKSCRVLFCLSNLLENGLISGWEKLWLGVAGSSLGYKIHRADPDGQLRQEGLRQLGEAT